MSAGLTIQDGTPKQIYHAPENRFVADFIGNANFLRVQPQGSQWALPDGTILSVSPDTQHLQGEKITALVRPEAIQIEHQPTAEAQPNINRFTGTVLSNVSVAGLELRAFSRTSLDIGSRITISFHANDCRLLNE
jgi:spermidine/putrescine transport system ATP-binding protein